MRETTNGPEQLDLVELAREIAQLSRQLAGEQVQLFLREGRHQLKEAGEASMLLGAGTALLAAGGILSVPAAVHLLHRKTGLPLWSVYGLLAGLLAAGGVRLLREGRNKAKQLQGSPFRQTVKGLKENLEWLDKELTAPRTS